MIKDNKITGECNIITLHRMRESYNIIKN